LSQLPQETRPTFYGADLLYLNKSPVTNDIFRKPAFRLACRMLPYWRDIEVPQPDDSEFIGTCLYGHLDGARSRAIFELRNGRI
jgi:hypothetical protein